MALTALPVPTRVEVSVVAMQQAVPGTSTLGLLISSQASTTWWENLNDVQLFHDMMKNLLRTLPPEAQPATHEFWLGHPEVT
jgi:hypothetical protein